MKTIDQKSIALSRASLTRAIGAIDDLDDFRDNLENLLLIKDPQIMREVGHARKDHLARNLVSLAKIRKFYGV